MKPAEITRQTITEMAGGKWTPPIKRHVAIPLAGRVEVPSEGDYDLLAAHHERESRVLMAVVVEHAKRLDWTQNMLDNGLPLNRTELLDAIAGRFR